ncbi:MAG: hypothetical protein HFF06_09010 [Oscillospiraceae bacterium]|nr:hypothetical protein [Oscillospiraceae bacterium]
MAFEKAHNNLPKKGKVKREKGMARSPGLPIHPGGGKPHSALFLFIIAVLDKNGNENRGLKGAWACFF